MPTPSGLGVGVWYPSHQMNHTAERNDKGKPATDRCPLDRQLGGDDHERDQPDGGGGERKGKARAGGEVGAWGVAIEEHPDRDHGHERQREVDEQREEDGELRRREPHHGERSNRGQPRLHPLSCVDIEDDAERRVADETNDAIRRVAPETDGRIERVEDPDRHEPEVAVVGSEVGALMVVDDEVPLIGEEGEVAPEPQGVGDEPGKRRREDAVCQQWSGSPTPSWHDGGYYKAAVDASRAVKIRPRGGAMRAALHH